jgi:hypothetical protein
MYTPIFRYIIQVLSFVSLQSYNMEDNQSWLDNNKENQFSVMLYSWLLKMTSTMRYEQLCMSQNRNMKESHLSEMEINVKVVHKNWYLTVSYSILKH